MKTLMGRPERCAQSWSAELTRRPRRPQRPGLKSKQSYQNYTKCFSISSGKPTPPFLS